ncbi:hypothetical protein FKM82_022005 [Ascaphus truei]
MQEGSLLVGPLGNVRSEGHFPGIFPDPLLAIVYNTGQWGRTGALSSSTLGLCPGVSLEPHKFPSTSRHYWEHPLLLAHVAGILLSSWFVRGPHGLQAQTW